MTYSRTREGDTTNLVISGTLDALTAPELRTEVDSIVSEDNRIVIVDLSDLELIDSSGVALLVALYKRVKGNHGSVRIRGLRDQPQAIFKLLHLDRVFGVAD
jgi:anti-sigma B factor antagonist